MGVSFLRILVISQSPPFPVFTMSQVMVQRWAYLLVMLTLLRLELMRKSPSFEEEVPLMEPLIVFTFPFVGQVLK